MINPELNISQDSISGHLCFDSRGKVWGEDAHGYYIQILPNEKNKNEGLFAYAKSACTSEQN